MVFVLLYITTHWGADLQSFKKVLNLVINCVTFSHTGDQHSPTFRITQACNHLCWGDSLIYLSQNPPSR